ncbi:co-chaperone HscB [Pseudidiomarina aestuarii]|uniref:co-chaperone HscB n=1 Tax=Pseudidiomarina aestuarii TaxID=624146 RepID=UPI003A97E884
MNHFELFGLPAAFAIDAAELQQRYRKLQQTLHPDRFANASQRDKLLAVQRTSQLNDAYQTLRRPLSRAEYMLELRGIDLQHEQQTLQDPEFLMAQMEWRERLEDLNSAADVLSAQTELDGEIKQLQTELESLIESEDNDAAANVVRKLKFMHKLDYELDAKEF